MEDEVYWAKRDNRITDTLSSITEGDFMEIFRDDVVDYEAMFRAYKDKDAQQIMHLIENALHRYAEQVDEYQYGIG